MTVREALDGKRERHKGRVTCLVLCKRELFYEPHEPNEGAEDATVYPVSREVAEAEAEWFGVPLHEV